MEAALNPDKSLATAKNKLQSLLAADMVKMSNAKSIAEGPGMYALYYDKKLVFIGATDNLRRRLRSLRGGSHVLSWRLRGKLGVGQTVIDYVNHCGLKVLELDILTAKLAAQIGISVLKPILNVKCQIYEAC